MRGSYKKVILSAVFFCLILCGCGSNTRKVLVVLAGQVDPSYEELKVIAEEWAESKAVSVSVVAPRMSTEYEQQKVLEEQIRGNRWDLVVIEPVGREALYPILDYAREQGSKIVAMQGDFEADEVDYTVSPFDYERLGSAMMDTFAEKMGETGSYVTLISEDRSAHILEEELACVEEQKYNYPRMLPTSRMQECGSVLDSYNRIQDLYKAYEMEGAIFFSHVEGLGISQWKQNTGNELVAVGVGRKEMMQSALTAGGVDVLFYWNQGQLLKATLEVGYRALKDDSGKTKDVITTNIDGYKTLRYLRNGTYCGNDIQQVKEE